MSVGQRGGGSGKPVSLSKHARAMPSHVSMLERTWDSNKNAHAQPMPSKTLHFSFSNLAPSGQAQVELYTVLFFAYAVKWAILLDA